MDQAGDLTWHGDPLGDLPGSTSTSATQHHFFSLAHALIGLPDPGGMSDSSVAPSGQQALARAPAVHSRSGSSGEFCGDPTLREQVPQNLPHLLTLLRTSFQAVLWVWFIFLLNPIFQIIPGPDLWSLNHCPGPKSGIPGPNLDLDLDLDLDPDLDLDLDPDLDFSDTVP